MESMTNQNSVFTLILIAKGKVWLWIFPRMKLVFNALWIFLSVAEVRLFPEESFRNVLARVDRQFLGEDNSDSPTPEQKSRGQFSGIFCDEQDPLCQKFQGALQPQQPSAIRNDDEIQFPRTIDDSQLIEQDEDGKTEPDLSEVQNNPDTGNMKPICEDTNPICQKFRAMLKYQSGRSLGNIDQGLPKADEGGTPNRPQSGSTSQTPWCEFVCDYFYHKVCYADGSCGDAVNEEVKPGNGTISQGQTYP